MDKFMNDKNLSFAQKIIRLTRKTSFLRTLCSSSSKKSDVDKFYSVDFDGKRDVEYNVQETEDDGSRVDHNTMHIIKYSINNDGSFVIGDEDAFEEDEDEFQLIVNDVYGYQHGSTFKSEQEVLDLLQGRRKSGMAKTSASLGINESDPNEVPDLVVILIPATAVETLRDIKKVLIDVVHRHKLQVKMMLCITKVDLWFKEFSKKKENIMRFNETQFQDMTDPEVFEFYDEVFMKIMSILGSGYRKYFPNYYPLINLGVENMMMRVPSVIIHSFNYFVGHLVESVNSRESRSSSGTGRREKWHFSELKAIYPKINNPIRIQAIPDRPIIQSADFADPIQENSSNKNDFCFVYVSFTQDYKIGGRLCRVIISKNLNSVALLIYEIGNETNAYLKFFDKKKTGMSQELENNFRNKAKNPPMAQIKFIRKTESEKIESTPTFTQGYDHMMIKLKIDEAKEDLFIDEHTHTIARSENLFTYICSLEKWIFLNKERMKEIQMRLRGDQELNKYVIENKSKFKTQGGSIKQIKETLEKNSGVLTNLILLQETKVDYDSDDVVQKVKILNYVRYSPHQDFFVTTKNESSSALSITFDQPYEVSFILIDFKEPCTYNIVGSVEDDFQTPITIATNEAGQGKVFKVPQNPVKVQYLRIYGQYDSQVVQDGGNGQVVQMHDIKISHIIIRAKK